MSGHKFAAPDNSWKVRAGVFAYRTAQTTIAGDVVARFSNNGDFEFTLSKGPGVTLLTIRQDATFAELKGPLARGGWAGAVANAPERLRGWLGLRQCIMEAGAKRSLHCDTATEKFQVHF